MCLKRLAPSNKNRHWNLFALNRSIAAKHSANTISSSSVPPSLMRKGTYPKSDLVFSRISLSKHRIKSTAVALNSMSFFQRKVVPGLKCNAKNFSRTVELDSNLCSEIGFKKATFFSCFSSSRHAIISESSAFQNQLSTTTVFLWCLNVLW